MDNTKTTTAIDITAIDKTALYTTANDTTAIDTTGFYEWIRYDDSAAFLFVHSDQ